MNVKINMKNKNRNMIFLKIGYYNSKNKSINKEDMVRVLLKINFKKVRTLHTLVKYMKQKVKAGKI